MNRHRPFASGFAAAPRLSIGLPHPLSHVGKSMKNLMYALRPLVSDFLSTFVFLGLIWAGVDIRIATASAIAFGVVQVSAMLILRRPVAVLQWAGLGLVVVLGAISIVTKDPRFIMLKPTIIYLAIGTVMLKRGWMLRYMPPRASGYAEDLMTTFGYVWAALMFVTAFANLVVAARFTHEWPLFTAVFPVPSKIALFAIQYLTVRHFARRRHMAQATLTAQAA